MSPWKNNGPGGCCCPTGTPPTPEGCLDQLPNSWDAVAHILTDRPPTWWAGYPVASNRKWGQLQLGVTGVNASYDRWWELRKNTMSKQNSTQWQANWTDDFGNPASLTMDAVDADPNDLNPIVPTVTYTDNDDTSAWTVPGGQPTPFPDEDSSFENALPYFSGRNYDIIAADNYDFIHRFLFSAKPDKFEHVVQPFAGDNCWPPSNTFSPCDCPHLKKLTIAYADGPLPPVDPITDPAFIRDFYVLSDIPAGINVGCDYDGPAGSNRGPAANLYPTWTGPPDVTDVFVLMNWFRCGGTPGIRAYVYQRHATINAQGFPWYPSVEYYLTETGAISGDIPIIERDANEICDPSNTDQQFEVYKRERNAGGTITSNLKVGTLVFSAETVSDIP